MANIPSKDVSRINLVQLVDDTGGALGVTASTTVKATAAAPTYVEGSTNPISSDLSGGLRVTGSFSASSVVKANAADPTYVEGSTANPVSTDLAGYQRVLAKQGTSNWTVNNTQVNGVALLAGNGVTGTGSMRVTVASDNTPFTVNAAQSGTWNVTNISGTVSLPTGAATAANQTTSNTNTGTTATNTTAISAAAGTISDAAWASGNGTQISLLKTIATQVLSTTPQATLPTLTATANGLTSSRVNAAASTNATSLKASAGNIAEIDVYNPAAYTVFLKLYNKASAPTVGTDTPVWTIPIAAGTGYSKTFTRGKSFATGIAYAITKLQADSDTTVVVAGDLTGSIDWV